MPSGAIVVFEVGSARLSLSRGQVLGLAPVPRLARPPAAPAALAGFFRRGAELVVALRTHVLLGIAGSDEPDLYSHLMLLRAVDPRVALLVDRVTDILDTERLVRRPIAPDQTHRDCVVAEYSGYGDQILLLDVEQILSEYERGRIRDFHDEELRRRELFGDAA